MDSLQGCPVTLVARDVWLELLDGTRLGHCKIFSVSHDVATAWIVHGGDDVFVPIDAITDVCELGRAVRPPSSRAA